MHNMTTEQYQSGEDINLVGTWETWEVQLNYFTPQVLIRDLPSYVLMSFYTIYAIDYVLYNMVHT